MSSYVNIESEELEVYVDLESVWLQRSIEEVFKQGGLFSKHQEGEYNRLYDSFDHYYEEWKTGEALKSAKIYSKPIAPGAPSIMTAVVMIGQVVGTIFGQAWVGAALNGIALSIQAADGTSPWKHVLTQIGVGALSAVSKGASDAITSGITYDGDGGVGWSKKQFKSGLKGNAVKAGLAAFNVNTFAREVIMSGLETEGDWNDFGFDMDNWKQHLVVATAATVSEGTSYGSGSGLVGQFLSQSIKCLAYKGLGSDSFTEEYGRQYSTFNWDTFGANAYSFGGFLGEQAGSYISERIDSIEDQRDNRGANCLPNGGNGMDFADDLLGGLWQGIKGVRESFNIITNSIIDGSGLGGVIGTAQSYIGKAQSFVDDYINVPGRYISGVSQSFGSAIAGGLRAGWNGVVNVAQSVGNWFSGDQSATVGRNSELRGLTGNNGSVPIGTGFMNRGLVYGSPEYNKIMKELGYTNDDYQIIEDKKTDSFKIIQQSNGGLNRQTTYYQGENITLDQYENYYNSNGKILKASDTLFIYNGDSVDRVNRAYDASGENVYETDVYTLNNQTGEFKLQYRDVWLRDASGNVMTNYKQGDYHFVMNNNIGTQAAVGDDGQIGYRNTNTSGTVGCLVSQAANFLGFMGLQNDPDSQLYGQNITPESVDNLLDKIDGYQEGNASMNQNALAEALELRYKYEKGLSADAYRQTIDERLGNGLPTIAYAPGHFVSIAGARYDSSGNITNYLSRDSARSGYPVINRNTLNVRGRGRISSLGWFN